jgi:hypothetical protein
MVTEIDTVGLMCERYNFNFLDVNFHTVFTTPLVY